MRGEQGTTTGRGRRGGRQWGLAPAEQLHLSLPASSLPAASGRVFHRGPAHPAETLLLSVCSLLLPTACITAGGQVVLALEHLLPIHHHTTHDFIAFLNISFHYLFNRSDSPSLHPHPTFRSFLCLWPSSSPLSESFGSFYHS